jgi:hypothetical protein
MLQRSSDVRIPADYHQPSVSQIRFRAPCCRSVCNLLRLDPGDFPGRIIQCPAFQVESAGT